MFAAEMVLDEIVDGGRAARPCDLDPGDGERRPPPDMVSNQPAASKPELMPQYGRVRLVAKERVSSFTPWANACPA